MNFNLADSVLDFFAAHKRDLPWRDHPTPYRVLVSEIMLQQTRVETVIPYYDRFISRCPDFFSLAQLDDDTLYYLWQGLGYYSRARNLRKTAQIVVEKYAGNLPDSLEELLELPGIGDYTGQAILSIAFHKKAVAIDGNVMRVFTRFWAVHRPIDEPSTKNEIRQRLLEVFPVGHASEFTQGLMEIGAMICIPNGTPKCERCPLSKQCQAYLTNTWNVLPLKKPKPQKRTEQYRVYLLKLGDAYVIHKRKDSGLLSGMYEFVNTTTDISLEEWIRNEDLSIQSVDEPYHAKHVFTHVIWEYEVRRITLKDIPKNTEWILVKSQDLLDKYPLPTAFSKLLK